MNANGDRDLSRLYRAGAREEPPHWLDESVLDRAARDAAATSSGSQRRPARWHAPLALAAVLVLAVSLVLVVDDEASRLPQAHTPLRRLPVPAQRVPAAPQQSEKAPAAEAPLPEAPPHEGVGAPMAQPTPHTRAAATERDSATPSQGADAAEVGPSGTGRQAPFARKKMQTLLPATRVPGPSGLSAPAEPAASEPFERAPRAAPTEAESAAQPVSPEGHPALDRAEQLARPPASTENSERRRTQARRDAPAAAPSVKAEAAATPPAAAVPPAGSSATAQAAAGITPEQLLQEIEQLKREGRLQEAKERIETFRRRYPNYPISPSLK